MDRVKKVKAKLNSKALALPVLIFGIVVSIILICIGAIRIHDLNKQVGTRDLDAINVEIKNKSEEYNTALAEENAEYEANGLSDKYIELNKKSTELSQEITKLTNSRYMKETGYNNPNSLRKILQLAPTIWIGALVLVAAVIAFVVMKSAEK